MTAAGSGAAGDEATAVCVEDGVEDDSIESTEVKGGCAAGVTSEGEREEGVGAGTDTDEAGAEVSAVDVAGADAAFVEGGGAEDSVARDDEKADAEDGEAVESPSEKRTDGFSVLPRDAAASLSV